MDVLMSSDEVLIEANMIEKFERFYETFDLDGLDELDSIYDTDVVFVDPLHKIRGLSELRSYFYHSMKGCNYCRFEFNERCVLPKQAFFEWTMCWSHPKIKRGNEMHLVGVSQIRFSNKVVFHRDYYDMGAMLYDNLPIIGHATRFLKSRIIG